MYILLGFISLAIFFVVVTRYRGKGYGKDFESYISEEREANSVKSKPIGAEDVYAPDMAVFPVRPDDGSDSVVLRRQRDVVKLSEKKMMRFDAPMTNAELKRRYGTVNLEVVSAYEENFYKFIYAVNDWAGALLEEGEEEEAAKVLEGGVLCGAETSKTYTMLADIYLKRNKRPEMRDLYEKIQGRRMPAQEKIWQYVNDCYVKMGL